MPEVRLIDANAFAAQYGDYYAEEGPEEGFIGTVGELIAKQPTIEAEPVRHGRWIDAHFVSGVDFNRCSECGCYIEKTFFANDYNVRYCPACGVKMDLRTPTEAQLDETDSVMMGGADNG